MKILDIPRSGSYQGITSSRNRYGQYVRTRAIPVNPNSSFQGTVRARLAANAADWRELTDQQREGWASLGEMMTRSDSLGQSYTPSGFQAFVSVNNNLLAAGEAVLTDAPALTTPTGLVSVTITLTAAAFSIAYTATPLGASERLFVYASPQRSDGRSFEGDRRLIQVGAAAGASPLAVLAAYEARLGDLVVGNKVFVTLRVHKGGFQSGPFVTSAVVA